MSEAEIRPAATVALLRDVGGELQVLLLRRNSDLKFAGGAWVFPGGALEAEESPAQAARRECLEECGVAVATSELVEYAHWTTPASGMSRRFATHFYAAQVAASCDVQIDDGEIHAASWLTPAAALAQHRRGELKMMPPTFLSLLLFERYRASAPLLAELAATAPYAVEPKIVRSDAGLVALYPGDGGFASGDVSAAGAAHRCLLDPSGFSYHHSGADVGWRAMDRCG
jgi:8-oxo-dGTP pyrophosphatase MutT (NUDIX family)